MSSTPPSTTLPGKARGKRSATAAGSGGRPTAVDTSVPYLKGAARSGAGAHEAAAMRFIGDIPSVDQLRTEIRRAHLRDETAVVERLIGEVELPEDARKRVDRRARELVDKARAAQKEAGGLDAFLHQFSLSTREGVVLMCLAEALLRIPDAGTADLLIKDKLGAADWESHFGKGESILVNAATWGLMLTGRIIRWEGADDDLGWTLRRVVARSGEPVIRAAVMQAMRILGRQFVMGTTIEEALKRSREQENRRYRYSFDMLGEAAHTEADALRYFEAYQHAIDKLGEVVDVHNVVEAPSVSVKLSALHSRYEFAQRARVMNELAPRLAALARRAKTAGIGLTVDAEEAARLEISLEVIEALIGDHDLAGWDGFGLAVQAYQKRAPHVIDWLADRARRHHRKLMVRLVKGAYWDSEIKRAQELGIESYPVFTRKPATDVSYIACAKRLFAATDLIYPQFATHNAHTIAVVEEMAGGRAFEFQRLHGMGETLYETIVGTGDRTCRVYAPVGSHSDLLPYLVRRLLENGANTSFVNRLVDDAAQVAELVADPVAKMAALAKKPHPRIPLPVQVLGNGRVRARGIDLDDPVQLAPLAERMKTAGESVWQAGPLGVGVAGPYHPSPSRGEGGRERDIHDPADRRRIVGQVVEAGAAHVDAAFTAASNAAWDWDALGAERRAAILDAASGLYEASMPELMALAIREGGKTIPDAVAEVREAVDFLRYYAACAREAFARPLPLPGPTGESNELELHGRGVFGCISPWNFPLAIFTGQVAAALAAGNAVLAKPAEQTPLIAAAAVRLLHRAGVPEEVLHLLPGDGPTVGAALVADPRTAGIAFTGSTEVAQAINRALASRPGPIVPLIAETGGQNAMIVDSSALPEQVVADMIASAFHSAGQRCSALRVAFVQADVAPKIVRMLTGAMAELVVGDPGRLATDVGPVIDADAQAMLDEHAARMERDGKLLYRVAMADDVRFGTFFAPVAFEIDRLDRLTREVFGPILHVIAYASDRLDDVLAAVRATGYGLTLGIHSRIDETVKRIHGALPVGNTYVNRNMIGAVVGVQPFGGEGLSGTGPKAGGPHYLQRFAAERTLTVNTAAMGGNASLLALSGD